MTGWRSLVWLGGVLVGCGGPEARFLSSEGDPVEPEACARSGGCYQSLDALEAGLCTLGCADRVRAATHLPEAPRLQAGRDCPEGWRATLLEVSPSALDDPPSMSWCTLPEPVPSPCPPGSVRPAGQSECRPLASCLDVDWSRALQEAQSEGGRVLFVGATPPEGIDGPSFAGLSEALQAYRPPDVMAFEGILTWTSTAPEGVTLVGRCPERAEVRLAEALTGLTVERSRVSSSEVETRVTGTLKVSASRLEGTHLHVSSEGRLHVADSAARVFEVDVDGGFDLRSSEWNGRHLFVDAAGTAELHGSRLDLQALQSQGRVVHAESILRVSSGLLRGLWEVQGGAFQGDFCLEGGRTELSEATFRAGQIQWGGCGNPGSSSAELHLRRVVFSAPDRPGAGARPALVQRNGTLEAEQLWSQRALLSMEGGTASLRDVMVEDGSHDLFTRKGPAILRMEGGELRMERAQMHGLGVGLQIRGASRAVVRDLWAHALHDCEPFLFGPPVRPNGRVEPERNRDCVSEFAEFGGPLPPDPPGPLHVPDHLYRTPWFVDLVRMEIRDDSVPKQKNSIRAVGQGHLRIRDLTHRSPSGRGLYAQGPVQLDVERASFLEGREPAGCSFPGLRFGASQPDRDELDDFPFGRIQGVVIRGMVHGFHLALPSSSTAEEVALEVRDVVVEDARVGVVQVLATQPDFVVRPEPARWQIRAAYPGVMNEPFGASYTPTCD